MLSVKQCFLYLQSCGFALICGLPTPKPPSLSALTLAFANKGDLLATLKPEIYQPPKSPFATFTMFITLIRGLSKLQAICNS